MVGREIYTITRVRVTGEGEDSLLPIMKEASLRTKPT